MRYVIIGRSAAGITAAGTIRENAPESRIMVVSGELVRPYYRPMLPLLLSGAKSDADISYAQDPFAGKNIESMLGTAVSVDPAKKEVLLASGERLGYDRLLLATGGAAIRPRIPGIELRNVYPIRSAAHAAQIRNAAATARSVVVIGGGLVGIKTALALRERAVQSGKTRCAVTVVEMMQQILGGRLDRRGAVRVRQAVERRGVTVMTGKTVSEIRGCDGSVSSVKLSSGKTLKADLVIVAAGVKPNTAFLRSSGIRTNRGVLVDESLRTSVPDVYAAGDLAETKDLLSGKPATSGLWTNAVEMGRIAGRNMTGAAIRTGGFLSVMNATEIAGVPFISVGQIEPRSGQETVARENEDRYWKLVFDGELLVGAVFVGDLAQGGVYTNLIKNRIPVSRVADRIKKRAARYADLLSC